MGDRRDIFQAIMIAADSGKGLRLSISEVYSLSHLPAIQDAANSDLEDCAYCGGLGEIKGQECDGCGGVGLLHSWENK